VSEQILTHGGDVLDDRISLFELCFTHGGTKNSTNYNKSADITSTVDIASEMRSILLVLLHDPIMIGMKVEIHGLKSQDVFNGQVAEVMKIDNMKNRYQVRMKNDSIRTIRAENVRRAYV